MKTHLSFDAWVQSTGRAVETSIDSAMQAGAQAIPPQPPSAAAAVAAAAPAMTSSVSATQPPGLSSIVPGNWLEQLFQQLPCTNSHWKATTVVLYPQLAFLIFLDMQTNAVTQVQLGMGHVPKLCQEVTNGQLPHLHAAAIYLEQFSTPARQLVTALAGQLVDMFTTALPSIELLEQLQHLQKLTPCDCSLTVQLFQSLCGHASLKELTLGGCKVQGDHSRCDCSWQVLTMSNSLLKDLLHLPVASTQQVRLVNSVSGEGLGNLPATADAVQGLLLRNKGKITCYPEPNTSNFTFTDVCPAVLPLLSCLVGVKSLVLGSHPSPEDVLQSISQNLPHTLKYGVSGVDWSQCWGQLPEQVETVTVRTGQQASLSDHLYQMVVSAPAHVTRVNVVFLKWDEAGLKAYAEAHFQQALPQHLSLIMSVDGGSTPTFSHP